MNERTAHLWRAILTLTTLTDGAMGFFRCSSMPRPASAKLAVGRVPQRRAFSFSLKSASEGQGVGCIQVETAAVPKQANHLLNRLGNPRFIAAPMVRCTPLVLVKARDFFFFSGGTPK
jgi:hypothetical protein